MGHSSGYLHEALGDRRDVVPDCALLTRQKKKREKSYLCTAVVAAAVLVVGVNELFFTSTLFHWMHERSFLSSRCLSNDAFTTRCCCLLCLQCMKDTSRGAC